jgi:RHS repeat-associated protein
MYTIAGLFIFCCLAFPAGAQTSITIKKPLDGALKQLAKDSAVTVVDSLYFDPQMTAKADTPYKVRNVVTFRINEESGVYLKNALTATIQLRIIYTTPDRSLDSVDKTLMINYAPGSKYVSRQSFVFNNAHKVTVKILDVAISGAQNYVLKSLVLENEMDIQPNYKFSRMGNAVQVINYEVPAAGNPDELAVSWPNSTGADEYDLEWAYIDSSALNRYKVNNVIDAGLVFRNNASRISTANLSYKIPLIYDNTGSLFFRVRAVQVKDADTRMESSWSSDFLPGGLGRFDFNGHERSLNWQSNISFAEDGKRKVVVQYYDGSLRNRQTVTKDNSVNQTIVSETLYDYQGRPVIQVMPAPTLNNIIGYSRNFNKGINGLEYTKDLYDSLPSANAYCEASAPAMDSSAGVARYYSALNPEITIGNNQLIPSAEGYAFTETEYTQDNTGRISRQGGVGKTFSLGSGHETKYYYASAPDQNALDALFGTEVGDNSHYFKNMVRDANGQYSVSYVDMHGRTIATALAGLPPDSIRLQQLDSYKADTVTESLAGAGNLVVKDLVMENKKSLLVPASGLHEFDYALSPQQLQEEGCNASAICYSCLYDLQITITDDCNNQKLGGKPFDTTIHNFSLGQIHADCANPAPGFHVHFSLNLEEGNYEITKKLSVNREALQYYRDSVFLPANTCVTLQQIEEQQRNIFRQEHTDCEPSCASCLAALGTWDTFRDKYLTQSGIALKDSAAYLPSIWQAYQGAKTACDALCNKTSETNEREQALLLDMTAPSGQYANPDNIKDKYSIFYADPSDENAVPHYKDPSVAYLDEFGKRDSVYNSVSGLYVLPQYLDPQQFAAAFKPSWAKSLLKFHPEYCKLQAYLKHQASIQWDRDFESTDTYQEANVKGYLNPTTNNTFRYAMVPANADPLSLESADYKKRLEDSLRNYGRFNNMTYGMWAMAAMMTKCDQGDNACIQAYADDRKAFDPSLCAGDLDMEWRNFRQAYLNVKNNLYVQLENGGCPVNSNNPAATELLAAGYTVNFMDAGTALAANGLGYLGSGNASDIQNNLNSAMNDRYTQNCSAYVKQWVQQLTRCTYYNPSDINNIIIPKLLQVCKDGADASHPYGSSTVKPGGTHTYNSFEEVINEYNQQHNITDVAHCNADLITAPLPYDKQTGYSDQMLFTKPDDCLCTTLNTLYKNFSSADQGYSSFSAYLKGTRQITMTDADLTQLLSMCNTASDCKYLSAPIAVPPALQCTTGGGCATCVEVDSLYKLFTTRFPGLTPTAAESDTVQQNINTLFANFMNNRLGFAKQTAEYLQFRDSCLKQNSSSWYTQVCDQEPNQSIKVYKAGGNNTSNGTDLMTDLKRTPDNGFIMAGRTAGFGNNGTDAYVIKTDSAGHVQWAKTYGGVLEDYFNNIRLTPDGGYIAAGTTKSFQHGNGDAFIVKMDASGNVVWSKTLGWGTPNGENESDILPLTGGGYAVSGKYNFIASQCDWFVAKLDNNGVLQWARQFGTTSQSDDAGALQEDGDTLLIAGITWNGNDYDGVLTKLDKQSGTVSGILRYSLGSLSSWLGEVFKTTAGYKINMFISDGASVNNGRNGQFEITKDGTIIRAYQEDAFPAPGMAANAGGSAITVNPDGTGMLAQFSFAAPRNLYWSVLSADNQIVSSNKIVSPDDIYVYRISRNPGDGSYVGLGNLNNNAMWMHVDNAGKTGCCDAAVNLTGSNLTISRSTMDAFTTNNTLPDGSAVIMPIVQTVHPTEVPVGSSTVCRMVYIGPLLCGNSQPVFPSIDMPEVNSCTDSTYFITSTSTEIYKNYIDSLKGSFDSLYAAKCLEAYRYEQFTVKRLNSEYHYTLYYYDQAGNLVKTVPPAGVRPNRDPDWLAQVKTARANGQVLVPAHEMVTQYRYNTLNQVAAQQSPDGGASLFWYDRLGRLSVSQNAKQATANQYSYTSYDYLGRITQVGQLTSSTPAADAITRNEASLQQWLNNAASTREQITQTVYDTAYWPIEPVLQARNLRNRVAWTALYNNASDLAGGNHATASFYSYDIHGNVDTLLQDYKLGVMNNANRFKKLVYRYDLVSGKVNQVAYQPGQPDAFYHRYTYDAENRLTNVETSSDSVYWENDAWYEYYRHGALARSVIGQQQVQGLDYAYTLQGWLKSINPAGINPAADGGTHSNVAGDAYNLLLNYHGKDFAGIGAGSLLSNIPGQLGTEYRPLYNGNISSMALNIGAFNTTPSLLYNYQYDQLNRLVQMDAWKGDSATYANLQKRTDFHEGIGYDANGNIQRYQRNGNTLAGKPLDMDNLTYHYTAGTNKLDYIDDAVPATNYPNDLDGQSAGNYGYDAIGNLTQDTKEGITNISWTVYGKIASITKADGTVIRYSYDAAGNRISKTVTSGGHDVTTAYVRDAQGNTISVYTAGNDTLNSGHLTQSEVDLYGSSRLGTLQPNTDVAVLPPGDITPLPGLGSGNTLNFTRGKKLFELSNHLGNVLITLSDRKNVVPLNDTTVNYYLSDVVAANDYYPGGMIEPERSYTSGNSYRYGFNGKEKDPNITSEDYDYGARIYDARVVRFLSVDRLAPNYPWYSPYHFAGGNPIAFNDLDGLEPKSAFNNWQPNTKKAGLQYWYGDNYEGYDDANLRQVVDNDKKVYWVISENRPGGIIYGEYNWRWYDAKTKKWLPFQPVGYESAKQIANSMKGADKMLLGILGVGLAAPLAAIALPEIVSAAGGADAIGSYFAKKSIDAGIDLFGQLSINHFDISKVDWFDVATNYLPINDKWNVFVKAAVKNIAGAGIDYTEEKGWRIAGLNKDATNATVEALVGTVADGLFGAMNKALEKQLEKAGMNKDAIAKKLQEIVGKQREAVQTMIKNAVVEQSKPNKKD